MTLLRCPFCGSDHLDHTSSDEDAHGEFYYVFCVACEASGPTDYDKAEAIRLWNTRREGDE